MSDFSYIFTVFTPTYNRAHTLRVVFESLLNQTFKAINGNPVFEWLVIDDGSTDETDRLVSRFQKEADFPIRYYYQDNSGKHVAMNKGVQLAQGALFLPADCNCFLTDRPDKSTSAFPVFRNVCAADSDRAAALSSAQTT